MDSKNQKFPLPLILSILLLVGSPALQADNILTVHDPLQYGAKEAFIDTCILEIEPHGSYIEQSLILTYSDHGQYSSDTQLEVVHQFELPAGAVINDLWLWMPDTVMKAIVIDTWTAQAIYDSIVSRARDPAFLSKKGNQFKLQVYPLIGGSYRKIRLNFIAPTRWLGKQPTAPLPLRMLQADQSETPMTLRFRSKDEVWGEPYLIELPNYTFADKGDSNGYRIRATYIEDISVLEQLNVAFQPHFTEGYYFRSYPEKADTSYFQLGLALDEFFHLSGDTLPHNFWLGVDLSGYYNNKPIELIGRLKKFLPAILRPKDTFQVSGVAGGVYENITSEPQPGDSSHILQALNQLQQSTLVDSALSNRKKIILYCDSHAATCWRFQGVEALATYKISNHILNCLHEFLEFDVVAAYNQGFEDHLTQQQADSVLSALDTFFRVGGHFLTFFDYNRDHGNEKVASSLIPGLRTKKTHIRGEIHGVSTGTIGRYFPESIWANTVNELAFEDPDVVIEVVDDAGEPVVISKRIHTGILIVSGIWSFGDDDTQRAAFGKPLLGLTGLSRYYQLPQLLDSLFKSYQRYQYDRILIFSNSDTLIPEDQTPELVSGYLSQFHKPYPRFNSVNLLDGREFIPLYVRLNDCYYYGNGYFMKLLADRTGGLHFELNHQDWEQIQAALCPLSLPPRENLSITYQVDNGTGNLLEEMEVAPEPFNTFKPSFFIGKFSGYNSFHVDINANFWGIDSLLEKALDFEIETDTTRKTQILPAMLGNEKILNLFASLTIDTAKIVQLAIENNLLTDYTGMLCLEPNDTVRQHQEEESGGKDYNTGLSPSERRSNALVNELSLSIFPNPFNLSTCISFHLPYAARM